MGDVDTTRQESAGASHPSGYSDLNLLAALGGARRLLWSPVYFSSPSASTEYWSADPSPIFNFDPSNARPFAELPWCELMTWSAPSLLEVYHIPRPSASASDDDIFDDGVCSESILETPEDLVDSLTQAEVDENVKEMTCGPMVEKHFWPIRYNIRSGELHLYENTINALILHARMEFQPTMLTQLTQELAAHRAESYPGLASYLAEGRSLCECLHQIASEMEAIDLQSFKDAVWKDSVIIILILYEILTCKADLEEVTVPTCRGATVTVTGRPLRCLFSGGSRSRWGWLLQKNRDIK